MRKDADDASGLSFMTSICVLVVRFFFMLKSEKVHNQTLGLGIPRWKACVGVFTGLCKKVRTLEEFAFFETRFLIIYIRGNFFLDASSFHDGIIYHLKSNISPEN